MDRASRNRPNRTGQGRAENTRQAEQDRGRRGGGGRGRGTTLEDPGRRGGEGRKSGTGQTRPQVSMNGSQLFMRLLNDTGNSISIPSGKNLIGMRYDETDGLVHFSLNGSSLGTASLSGSTTVTPPLALGSTVTSYSASFKIWALLGWLRNNRLDSDQENDIITNLTTLHGPFGV